METARLRRRSKAVRWAYGTAGAGLFGLGALGIVTPLLPTTIFWIMATGCLLKANPGAVRPILRTPYIGPIVKKFMRWRPWGARKRVKPAA
ncbi:MAG: hypothetical protein JWO33_2140 [Caulobacteraceae bacterium]|nr:hypothetical protein [Caulobacteraceae bacterium]